MCFLGFFFGKAWCFQRGGMSNFSSLGQQVMATRANDRLVLKWKCHQSFYLTFGKKEGKSCIKPFLAVKMHIYEFKSWYVKTISPLFFLVCILLIEPFLLHQCLYRTLQSVFGGCHSTGHFSGWGQGRHSGWRRPRMHLRGRGGRRKQQLWKTG